MGNLKPLDDIRGVNGKSGLRQALNDTGAFRVESIKATSQVESFTDALRKQDVSLLKLRKSGELLNEVYKEQYRLSKMTAMGWQMDARGRVTADMIIPKDVPERLTSLKRSFSEVSSGATSFGQVLQEQRMRLGVFSEALKGGSNEMIKWGKNTQWAGRQLMVGMTLPFAAFGAVAAKTFYDVDQNLTKIARVYDYTAEQTKNANEKAAASDMLRTESMHTARQAAELYATSITDTLDAEAQLAAAGQHGHELQQNTLSVQRASMLGGMDYNKTVEATIALQTVFKQSATEVADSFNYMNAMENQTVLTMEDFTDALPRVAGLLAPLGGTLQDIGTMLTAMKAASITAAQGANALKSSLGSMLLPTTRAQKMLKEWNINLGAIVESNNGNLLPSLKDLAAEFQNVGMSALDQEKIMYALFGKYQAARVNAIVTGLRDVADANTQVGRAADIASKGSAKWADIAAGELVAAQQSASFKFRKTLQTMKADLAEAGQPFLEFGTTVLGVIGKILDKINGLGDGQKKFLMLSLGFIALIGPAIMITGIMANFIGQVIRGYSSILQFASGFKILSANQRVQQLVAKQSASVFATEAQQADLLRSSIDQVTRSVIALTDAQRDEATMRQGFAPLPRTVKGDNGRMMPNIIKSEDKRGQTRYYHQDTDTGKKQRLPAAHPEVIAMNSAAKEAEASTAAMAKNADAVDKSMTRTANKMVGFGFAAGMLGSMAASSDSLVGHLSQGLTIATMIGMALGPEKIGMAFSAIGSNVKVLGGNIAGMAKEGGRFSGMIAKGGSVVARIAANAGPIGIALAVAAGSAYLLYKHLQRAQEQIHNISQAGNTMTEILGGVVKKTGEWVDKNGEVHKGMGALVDEFTSKNKDAVEELKRLAKAGDDAMLKKRITQIAVDVYTNTGDVKKAQQAVQVALNAAGEGDRPKMLIDIDINSEKAIADAQKKLQDDLMKNVLRNNTGEGHKFWSLDWNIDDIDFGMNNHLKEALKHQAEDLGKTWNDFMNHAITGDVARKKFEEVSNAYIDNATAAVAKMRGSFTAGDMKVFARYKIDTNDDKAVARALLTNKDLVSSLRETGNTAVDSSTDIGRLIQAFQLVAVEQSKLTHTQNTAGASTEIFNKALQDLFGPATSAADVTSKLGKESRLAADDVDSMANALSDAKDNIGAWQQKAMENSWASIMDAAHQQFDNAQDAAIASAERKHEAATARIDAESKVQEKAYDTRAKNLDSEFDRKMDDFDTRWKVRKQSESDVYDNRIKKIDATIKKEQDAESLRQKVFEAEKSRLQRLADMASSSIDINMALNSGDMDSAAKLINTARASQADWANSDAQAGATSASEQRIKDLEDSKKPIEDAKKAHMDRLDDIEKAEKKALDNEKKRRQESLNDEKERYKEGIDARKAAEDAKFKASEDSSKRSSAAAKQSLDDDLAALKASTPRTKAEMDSLIAQLEVIYNKHHVYLNTKSAEWGTMVTRALQTASSAAIASVANDAMWKKVADDAANAVTSAFGMSKDEFIAWVTTGKMPKAAAAKQGHEETGSNGQAVWVMPNGKRIAFHTGGQVGRDIGGRTGVSNANSRLPSEVDTRLKVGEYVVNRRAVDKLGTGVMDSINDGKLPSIGGATGLGPAGWVAASMVGVMRGMVGRALMNGAMGQISRDASAQGFDIAGAQAGKYGGISFDNSQMQNAAAIIGVGRGMGATDRDLVIALMTSLQESGLKNISYGDRDSVGLFQQRTSQGWGSVEQIMDPKYSSRKFFEGLLAIGDRDSMSLTQAAQAVQRSAFPNAYAKWEDEARAILDATSNGSATPYSAGDSGPLMMPLNGRVTSHYGMRTNPVTGQYVLHNGADIAAPVGTAIRAAAAGTVLRAGPASGYGNWTVLGHPGGLETGYAHQSAMFVSPGDVVRRGQVIGSVGMTGNTTGPHLHFQTGPNGAWVNPNQYIPGLKVGGNVVHEGIAKLHDRETVLTAPLSQDLKNGIQNLDSSGGNTYSVTVDLRGAYIRDELDIEAAVEKAINKKESKLGRKRVIT